MSDARYLIEMISEVPVVTGPAEIDVTTAGQLRTALLEAGGHGHTTIVVDLTRTRFCDSAGLGVLIRAHKRALEEGGEVRLVMPPGGAVYRIFTLTSLYRCMPRFDSLPEALRQRPVLLGHGTLEASVGDGESGPVITLCGEADVTSAAQLNALITVQLSGGTRHLTIDVAGLSLADSVTVRALVLAARTLKERGGTLALLHPQPALARLLALTGADQMIAIDGQPPGSQDRTG